MAAPPPVYTVRVEVNPTQTIALRLLKGMPPNDDVPYELQPYYNKDVWMARQRAVLTKGSRYLKPRFEIIFAIFMLLASLAVPITIYYVVLNALPQKLDRVVEENGRVFFTDERYWQARAASVGSFLGLFLLGWVPFFLWKAHGKRQVNQMLAKFSAEDAAVKGPGAQVPQWSMKMPGIGSKALHVMITYPRPTMVTPFQMGATLPPYLVNQPIDPNAGNYYTPYMSPGHAQGQPHHAPMSNMPGVPLYNDRDEKIPEYTGPTSDAYLPHEKERFEDIKV
ncbi:hypothetical protein L226DRAFT_535648 [Lentinus tigrinus ALCF2SS1-7]|uniref:uncharacterized protein n=1 Tax=Lentinus tigrinus ALCF2SS1-7 TaxID=1328758 RepID=UPI0011660616|nr:hypothetical protein L226DRAFT_535648 [Lentinus tigrinus ALCF2SS1-7]